jgi:predicted phage terminase large subunit-like protein
MQNLKQAYEKWQEHCKLIQLRTTVDSAEDQRQRSLRIARCQKDYSAFVDYYFPHLAKSKTAKFQVRDANMVLSNKKLKAVFEWARGHAKSTHFGVMIPMWLMIQKEKEINVMILVSKSQDMACRLLGDLQAELMHNKRFIQDYGEQFNSGSWTDGEFKTLNGNLFIALGRGQSPRGIKDRGIRPDYVICDDIDDDELVKNQRRVNEAVNWTIEALYKTIDMGAGRFIIVGNRIGKKSILADVAKMDGVYHTIVNSLDKNGNPSWPEKWTREEVLEDIAFMGYRRAQKEHFNNPITEGAVFKNDWIRWKNVLPLHKYDMIVAYIDPSFKSTAKSDYKAIKVWGAWKNELHNIAAFVRQCTVGEMVRWLYDYHEQLPDSAVCYYFMEANFLQDLILDEFEKEGELRGYQLPIAADKRSKPDKHQRIEAVSPLWERGFVYYNEALKNNPDMITGIEQTLAFEKGGTVHDDGPDADEGAIWILQRHNRQIRGEVSLGIRTNKRVW